MHTIAFYSYKGGVGRSLLVANAARYLAMLGKKVVALDLDLEAPGLPYKFQLDAPASSNGARRGVVDILSVFLETGRLPNSLTEYTIDQSGDHERNSIRLMPAGNAPHGDYWRSLAGIDWHKLLYSPMGQGALFFLELRELISREYSPDFCLIDARTGITDMGGIATTLLPDTVVCLGLESPEHLDGLRAAMRGIRQTTTKQHQLIELVPVISRLRNRRDIVAEQQEIERIRQFFNEPLPDGSPGLNFDEIPVLHSEPMLEQQERLLVGGKASPYEVPLLRDYVRLFSLIIPPETLRHHIGELVRSAVSRLLDDPEGTQSNLEALTAYCADPDACLALLKVYRVTKAPLERRLRTASLMWQVRPTANAEPLVQEIVEAAYSEPRSAEMQKQYVDFAEDVWRATGMANGRVGISITNAMGPEQQLRAIRLLLEYLEKNDSPDASVVVALLGILRASGSIADAGSIVSRFKSVTKDAAFMTEWAKLAVEMNDPVLAKKCLDDPHFKIEAVRGEDPATAYRLLRMAGSDRAPSVLSQALEVAINDFDLKVIRAIGSIYAEEGREQEFVASARGRLPDGLLEEFQSDGRSAKSRWRRRAS